MKSINSLLIQSIFVTFILFPCVVFSQTNFWQQTNGPISFSNGPIAIDSNGNIFVGGSGGVHRSRDSGATWTQLLIRNSSYERISSIIINSNDDIVIYWRQMGLYRSTDNGDSWAKLKDIKDQLRFYSFRELTLAVNSRDYIFAGIWERSSREVGLYRSTDNGDSWVQVGWDNVSFRIVAINSDDDIFAYTEPAGAIRSIDNGETWSPIHTGLPQDTRIAGFAFHPDGDIYAATVDGEIYRSATNGDDWVRLNYKIDILFQVTIDSEGIIFVGSGEGVYRSDDKGDNWERTNMDSIWVETLTLDPNENLYIGTRDGLFFTSDKGDNWVLRGVINSAISSLVMEEKGQIYAAGGRGLYTLDDDNINWTVLSNQNLIILAVDTNGDLFAGTSSGAIRSTDGGQSWNRINEGLPTGSFDNIIYSLVIHPNGNLYAGTPVGVYRSADKGENWVEINNGISDFSNDVRTIIVDTEGRIYAGTDEGIFRSEDLGDSWSHKLEKSQSFNSGINSIILDDEGNLYASSAPNSAWGNIFQSSDNGETWIKNNAGIADKTITSLASSTLGFIYAGTTSGLFRYNAGDGFWSPINSGLTNMDVSAIIVDSDGFVFAGTEGSGVFRSTDQQNVLFVYPGDTNNDGVVDARDILPIGRYFGITGSSREDLSLDWRAQELTSLWAPIDASFADSDGNGKVEANDVEGIIKNWNATQTGGVALSYSSVEVSRQLLNVIGSNPQSEPMKAIRKYLLKYISENNVSTLEFSLDQNWPNPFNSSTTIRYNISERSKKVKITIFNISGQQIWEKTDTNVQPGSYEFKWAGKTTYGLIVPSGVYFYRLQADSYNETKEMVLLK